MTSPALRRTGLALQFRLRHLQVQVSPSILVLLGMLAFLGSAPDLLEVPEIVAEYAPGHPVFGSTLGSAAAFVALVVLGISFHELGHVLAGRLTGHNLYGIRVAATPGVYLLGEPYGWRRMVVSAAGPLAEGMYALVLFSFAPGESWWRLLSTVGGAATFSGLLALGGFFPQSSNSDGRKLWRGLGQAVRSLWVRLRST